MKTLIIGSGGREHALVKAALNSELSTEVIAAPGNAGMAQEVPCFVVNVADPEAIVQLAQEQKVDFVIIGPELPLSMGVVDKLEAAGIAAYGPNQKAAQLEASKVFTKNILEKYNIPTAASRTFNKSQVNQALEYLDNCTYPIVIKADGLAAGKGVIIAEDKAQAQEAVESMLKEDTFGQSGDEILIEEFLAGEEASLMVIVSKDKYALLHSSQDHKKIGEKDTGPNTGGMGAYAPAPVLTPELLKQAEETIVQPILSALIKEDIEYKGTLYIGLMLTPKGPKVLEFNVRFGDPECQVLFPLIESDPIELLHSCATGKLDPSTLKLKDAHAVVVVQAAAGYPGNYKKGDIISLPQETQEHSWIIHAGTAQADNGDILTNGGRVLGVTAIGSSLEEATKRAYSLCEQITFEGCYYRKDIAHKELHR